MNTSENTIKEIQIVPRNSDYDDTSVNQIELSEKQANFFRQELSHTTSILNESIELLHGSTVKMLKKENPEVRQPSQEDIIQARLNMETVAKMIQTKINYVKVFKQ